MKNITFAFILATGFGFPGLLHAGGTATGISASFERDLNRQQVISYAIRQDVDPVQYLVNNTLRGRSDQLVASFERDLNRQPIITHVVRQDVDPVQYLVNNTLRGRSDHTLASLRNDITGVDVLD